MHNLMCFHTRIVFFISFYNSSFFSYPRIQKISSTILIFVFTILSESYFVWGLTSHSMIFHLCVLFQIVNTFDLNKNKIYSNNAHVGLVFLTCKLFRCVAIRQKGFRIIILKHFKFA